MRPSFHMDGHTYSKRMNHPGKVANPAPRGQLNRENKYFAVHYPPLIRWAHGICTYISINSIGGTYSSVVRSVVCSVVCSVLPWYVVVGVDTQC